MTAIESLWRVLTPDARRRFLILTVFSTVSGFLETASIGLIIPFIAAATQAGPSGGSRIWTDNLHAILLSAGIGQDRIAAALACLFVFGTVAANLTVVYYQYYALKVVYGEKAEMSSRLLRKLIYMPLGWYERENSGELSKSIMADVDRVINSLLSLTQLLGIAMRSAILALFFLAVQLKLAIALTLSLGGTFFLVFRFIQQPLVAAGNQSLAALTKMYEFSNAVFGGAREIKVTDTSKYFLERFDRAAHSSVYPEIVRGMPPHVTRMSLETLIFTIIAAVLWSFNHRDGNLNNGMPLLSAYAIAGVRLLPALQQGLYHWVSIRFLSPSVFRVEELLAAAEPSATPVAEGTLLRFEKEIVVDQIEFSYAGTGRILNGISLSIQKYQRVAFVGTTGSGKSTLLDLLLTLRSPDKGSISVDGVTLNASNQQAWLAKVGYVPQNVYFLDGSIIDNVAFGLAADQVDIAKVESACRLANIHDFIVSELPDGYASQVGERGCRLSGGQAQRLSIARALYHDPDVVLFDEATSALDHATEDSILKALDSLRGRKTLVVVAHRLNTVWDFDCLYVIDKGTLVGQGTSSELMANCPPFQTLARQHRS